MSVVCRFRCDSVSKYANHEVISLHALTHKENEEWSKWTPAGKLEITVSNPIVFGTFVPGKDYYLNITEAA